MKFLLWHVHEWVYNYSRDTRKCKDCGRTQYGELVGVSINEPPSMIWREKGFPCKRCGETGEILEGADIVTCYICGGTGYTVEGEV